MFERRDVREELTLRRGRLAAATRAPGAPVELQRLLREVDQALGRIEEGTYGLCETCGDPIEADRLAVDPLMRFCLDHLTDREARDLERDLELAARVQAGFLPGAPVVLPGWEIHHRYLPAGLVGGDYVDVQTGPDGTVYAAVGDVSGKGVAASLMMAHLAALVRSLTGLGPNAAELVERANRLFCESTIAAQYATLFMTRVAADGVVDYCGAGHPAALLCSRGAVTLLPSTGLPVGMFCGSPYLPARTHLEPGDALLLYSDGIPEARDPDGLEYGIDRLATAFGRVARQPAPALVAALLDDLVAFRRGAGAADDVTLLVLRRDG